MSQKTFIEKQAKIGNVTVTRDWSMGKYGINVSCDQDINSWSTDIYEFKDEETTDSVFNLLVSVVVEMSPEIIEATKALYGREEQYEREED